MKLLIFTAETPPHFISFCRKNADKATNSMRKRVILTASLVHCLPRQSPPRSRAGAELHLPWHNHFQPRRCWGCVRGERVPGPAVLGWRLPSVLSRAGDLLLHLARPPALAGKMKPLQQTQGCLFTNILTASCFAKEMSGGWGWEYLKSK